MIWYERIKALIDQKGWSENEFARRIGAAAGTLSNWKRVGRIPVSKLNDVACELGTSPEYLRGESDDPSPNQDGAPTPEQNRERERALKHLGVIKDDGSIDHDLIEVAKVFLKSYQEVSGKGKKD